MKALLGARGSWLGAGAWVALALACDVPPLALYPLSNTSADRRWEPGLLGTWIAPQDSTGPRFAVTRTGYYRYAVTVQGPQLSLAFTAYLVPVAGTDFLDLTADSAGTPEETLLEPVHLVTRIWLLGDTLWSGWAADDRWVEGLQRHGAAVVRDPRRFLLVTVGTDSLRALLQELLQDSTVSWHPAPWVRDPRAWQPPPVP